MAHRKQSGLNIHEHKFLWPAQRICKTADTGKKMQNSALTTVHGQINSSLEE